MSGENQVEKIEEMSRDLHITYDCAEYLMNSLGYHKQSELTPCDCCRFNPPSSGDGKPCSICPAQAK